MGDMLLTFLLLMLLALNEVTLENLLLSKKPQRGNTNQKGELHSVRTSDGNAPLQPYLGNIDGEEPLLYGFFPDGFIWGAATSALQVEGWGDDDRGLAGWDVWAEEPGHVTDGSDASKAADSFHKWREDLTLVEAISLNTYRLSISWPRLLPQGTGQPSAEGLAYYRGILEECQHLGISPLVTLSHFDMPADLELEAGGWLNPDSISWFLHFAHTCLTGLGDLVPRWITFNEPLVTAFQGYETGVWPPGVKERPGEDLYLVARHILLAHAATFALYHQELGLPGQVGITLNSNWFEPKTEDEVEAAERSLQFYFGLFAAPLVFGNWPPMVEDRVRERSFAQGFNTSRLPAWSGEEQEKLRATFDFLGLNTYSTSLVANHNFSLEEVSAISDMGVAFTSSASWFTSAAGLGVVPAGIRRLLAWVSKQYGNPPVIVTENGVCDRLGNLDDMERVYYYKHYINQVLKAITLDDYNVIGYVAWSLLDNFEWSFGYSLKFGLVNVDFSSENKTRSPKLSSRYLAKLASTNGFVPEETPCL